MRLFGSRTSPFVRRVRVVAAEIGEPVELIDTATAEGAHAMRAISPINKVPVAEWRGAIVFDSRAIVDELLASVPNPPIVPLPAPGHGRIDAINVVNVADEAATALVRVFMARREGVGDGVPMIAKERMRAAACLAWLEAAARGTTFDGSGRFGVPELTLVTTLAWARFRDVLPPGNWPHLAAMEGAHADRPSLRTTLPGQ